MRKMLIALVCVVSVLGARPARAGVWDYVSPSKNWQRIKACCSRTSAGVTTYCANKVERARADQEKMWGLKLPADLNAGRPLVVMIHGLDSDAGVFTDLARLVAAEGLQVGYFSYPSDGPIAEDARRLSAEMAGLRARYPGLRVHLIGHSMGAVVARAYIEGAGYTQAVDRFIAIGPPNNGSPWTRQRWLLEAHEQYWLWRTNKDWSPIWMFTDGHGEAADDLKPGSAFLRELNDRPRREGVRYTIIVGDHNILARFGANAVGCVDGCVTTRMAWWSRPCHAGLACAKERLARQAGESDGVVPIASARLAGVSDVVVRHADHNTLVMGDHGRAPAAWEAVRERLVR